MQTQAQSLPNAILTKGDLVILSAILAEQKISSPTIWECLQKDLLAIMESERLESTKDERLAQNQEFLIGDFSTYSHILDCLYRTSYNINEDLVNKIGFDSLQSELLTPKNLALNQSETLKFFRGIF